jgi:hypothetical protein
MAAFLSVVAAGAREAQCHLSTCNADTIARQPEHDSDSGH